MVDPENANSKDTDETRDVVAGTGGARKGSEQFRETLRILRDDPASAVGQLRSRITSGNGDYRTWHNLAVALANSGDRAGALEAVLTALDQFAESPCTQLLLGILLREQGQFESALAAFERAAELDGNLPRLHANLGITRFYLEDAEGALEDLRVAVQRDPTDSSGLFNLAVVYVTRKRFDEARQIFERLVDIERERAAYYHQFLVELGRVQVIEETLTQAHRIKNFMGIVGDRLRTFCEQEQQSLHTEAGEDLGNIRDDYERIYADLVAFLRAIRPRPMRLENVDLRRLIDTIAFVASDRSRGIHFKRQFEDSLPEITCDIEMLQEALLNLILNAFDAVRSRYGDDPEGVGEVSVSARSTGNGVRVTIRDNGVGIPEGELGRIFKFGFTTKRLGTGIGLAFTRKTLQDHGGEIEVESREGEGTSLHCTLPLRPQISENLSNLALRSQLFNDPRELILEEKADNLGI